MQGRVQGMTASSPSDDHWDYQRALGPDGREHAHNGLHIPAADRQLIVHVHACAMLPVEADTNVGINLP